jgi:hypothetical protein
MKYLFAVVAAAVAALAFAAGGPSATRRPIRITSHTLEIEELGPKYLLGAGTPVTPSLPIRITSRTLEVEELGPKYLLGS